jgi:hypothetical protein
VLKQILRVDVEKKGLKIFLEKSNIGHMYYVRRDLAMFRAGHLMLLGYRNPETSMQLFVHVIET